jgi:MFS family permease
MRSTAASMPRGVLLLLLTLIYVCNTIDRQIIAILAEPIRLDLKLSDTQLGLLTGLVFSFFYTLFGVPVGWLADRLGRIRVLVVSCAVWSMFSALGGLATNFTHLALARVGVGVGEAGGAAPSYSLISSAYAPHERGRALGLFHLGSPIASLIGTFACAWIAIHYSWRTAIVVVSLPGIAMALLLYFSVREPPREATQVASVSLAAAVRAFMGTRVLWLAGLTAGLSSFTTYAMAAWLPAFLMRVKGMTLAELGIWYALGNSLTFGFGLWFGGYVADRIASRTRRAYALVPCVGLLCAVPFVALALLAPTWQLSLPLWMVATGCVAAFLAPGATLVQNVSPPSHRAVFSAMFLFMNNSIGAGLGPLCVGVISDRFHPVYPDSALALGLAACLPVLLVAAAAQYVLSRQIVSSH